MIFFGTVQVVHASAKRGFHVVKRVKGAAMKLMTSNILNMEISAFFHPNVLMVNVLIAMKLVIHVV